ncbi:cysteine desulfurase [candidate division WWE3 bacterium]|uniref:cysteine desulfurase n=1 Tax=candidate division WWE3 bacterium TaxID=2053526 RepID=A0A955LJK5_UNCKA|nr:cysteine desulfurase [candidate division WWE3 bacterium]
MNIKEIRSQFPYLEANDQLIYLDNAATTQLPQSVIDAISEHYKLYEGNVGRGNHSLTRDATARYEAARQVVAGFINADVNEVIFTKNTTDGINLTAEMLSKLDYRTGDVILLTQIDHHSNLTPWLALAKEKALTVRYVPLTSDYALDQTALEKIVSENQIRIFALPHSSNVLGTINPVKEFIATVKKHHPSAICLVDAAQSVGHIPADVKDLGCDLLAFSAHKLYGPQGIGVLYGKKNVLGSLGSPHSGGGTVEDVTWTSFTLNKVPHRFEVGTPNVAGVVGLATAVKFVQTLGIDKIMEHEQGLRRYLLDGLESTNIPGLKIYSSPGDQNLGVVSLNVDGIDAFDLATLLDEDGIMVRAGNHCAIPLHTQVLKTNSTLRISFGIYNTVSEVDAFLSALKKACTLLK